MLVIILLALVVLIVFYKFSTRNFDYWKNKNVKFKKPLPFFGNVLDIFALHQHMGYNLSDLYNQFDSPYFGLFIFNTPYFVAKDPTIVRSILVKDFNYFSDRTIVSDEKSDSLMSKMLFVVKNPLWKALRSKITPVFTTGKLKNMTDLLNQSAEEMVQYLEKNVFLPATESKEVCSKYATDAIASCAFGINAHSFHSEDAEFRKVGKSMVDLNFKTKVKQLIYFFMPRAVSLFRIPFFDTQAIEFIRSVFWKSINNRNEFNYSRNDVIDILIQMMKDQSSKDGVKFEGDTVVAQVAQFFSAGFETVASTMSFALYELCLHSKVQNKVRLEIKKVLSAHGRVTYEAIQDMKYLHMVMCETLRRYPVLPFLDRTCLEDYNVPGTDLIIEKGTPVYIPMFGLHYDPKYFPNPELFDPERFSDANKGKITSFSYIPFGEGPRNCIGERFGLMSAKIGLIHIISNFVIEKSSNTPVPLEFDNRSIFLMSKVGIPLRFSKRRLSSAG